MPCLRKPSASPFSLLIQRPLHPPFPPVFLSHTPGTCPAPVMVSAVSPLESNLLQTPHHLTPIESNLYKNRGRGWLAHTASLESIPSACAAVTSLESALTKKAGVEVLLLARSPTRKSGLTSEARKDLSSRQTIEDSDLVGKDLCPERRPGERALPKRTPNFSSARHRSFLDDLGPGHKRAVPGLDRAGKSARHPNRTIRTRNSSIQDHAAE
jgi:hypothetical protein